jgi:hypothetical protein
MNCNAEISPQYVHAIANNICPGCGGSIYDEPTKELYTELKEAMLRMPNDPVGVAGWLLDNYKLHKIGTAEPVSRFYNANTKEPEPQEKEKVKSASSEKTKDFFQRAGVSPQTKRNLSKNYSSLVEQINNNINEMYGEEDEVDMGSEFSPEDDLIAARSMNAKFAEEEIILPGKPLGRHEVNELKALLSKNSSTSDVILENERLEKLQRQENMLSGGGGFKRS